ncbi:hypothetical protein LTR82_017447 [Friedmanniomyces endolithicus]|uniref:Uncharacterized protein n=1 Tax=Friedmanniomyces endolithicus TaxID=329885 RepID=A0AAN6IZR9_9PEZI|nr:hypothetical protein LTR82_017447 [Friedmanniomyces endolithicus]
MDLPILRRLDMSGAVSPDLIMTSNYLAEYLTQLGFRAGYSDRIATYSLRRGFGNQIDRYVTAVQRRRQIGHKSDDTFMAYISRISGVHLQAIMNGTEQDHEGIDFLRSMRPQRDLGAPQPGRSSLTDVRFWRTMADDKQEADLQFMESRVASKSKDTYPIRRQRYDDSLDIFTGAEEVAPFSSTITRGPPSRHLQIYLRCDTARANMIQSFYRADEDSHMRLSDAVAVAAALSVPDPPEWFYPCAQSMDTGHVAIAVMFPLLAAKPVSSSSIFCDALRAL